MESLTHTDPDGYTAKISIGNYCGPVVRVTVQRGGKSSVHMITELLPLHPAQAEQICRAGANPADYVSFNGGFVRRSIEPLIRQCLNEIADAQARADAIEAHLIATNVPGLEALRTARDAYLDDAERARRQFARMMEDEDNDGARPPKSADKNLEIRYLELRAQYPRAAEHLRAEGYRDSDNADKSIAGDRAMEIIKAGGSIAEAESVLANWLPAEKIWD